jgi:hypothetical protein
MTEETARVPGLDGRSARLRCVLVSLATPPEAESGKSVAASGRVENLVVEFDEAYTAFVDGFERLPGESQLKALQAVDSKLSAMVRARDASLWTARGCREDSSWIEVRALAGLAMGEFDWLPFEAR